jgi:hypothetical protein
LVCVPSSPRRQSSKAHDVPSYRIKHYEQMDDRLKSLPIYYVNKNIIGILRC